MSLLPVQEHVDWRYERKFLVDALDALELEYILKLHPYLFREIYHKRVVNNIYFDTSSMNSYHDNDIGVHQRSKVRIRWYGAIFGDISKPILEIKLKNGLLGQKLSYELMPFAISKQDIKIELNNFFERQQSIPPSIKIFLSDYSPVLINTYNRKYFQSVDRFFRVTIDSKMGFYKIHHKTILSNDYKQDYRSTILEMKYNIGSDNKADYISNYFNFRMTKSSKYVSGIQLLYGMS